MSIPAIFGVTTPNLPAFRGYGLLNLWFNAWIPSDSRSRTPLKSARLLSSREPAILGPVLDWPEPTSPCTVLHASGRGGANPLVARGLLSEEGLDG